MQAAPENTQLATMGQDGVTHWAVKKWDGYKKLRPEKDYKTGAVRMRECGEYVTQPIAWWIPRQR
jgi:hypothetical protein